MPAVAERPAPALWPIPDRLIGRHDLARLFDVSLVTVRAWERDGKLPPAVRMGRKPFWPPDAIRAFFEARLAEGRGGAA